MIYWMLAVLLTTAALTWRLHRLEKIVFQGFQATTDIADAHNAIFDAILNASQEEDK